MTMVIKARKTADGGWEHYVESTETPAGLHAKATALLEWSKAMLENVRPTARTVPCLTPKAADGSGGEVEVIRAGKKPTRRYAESSNDAAAPMAAAPDDLHRAASRLKEVDAIIADPATDDPTRTSAMIERSQLLEIISSTATALKQHHRVGAPATAGQAQQYAPATPYFRLSDAKRVELEAEASALRGKIAKVGLRPEVKDKLKQDLAKIEHLLGMDRSPTADSRPVQELRMQG